MEYPPFLLTFAATLSLIMDWKWVGALDDP